MNLLEPIYYESKNFLGIIESMGWYIAVADSAGDYLHTDLVVRQSTRNMETGITCGYFISEENAKKARLAYLENEK